VFDFDYGGGGCRRGSGSSGLIFLIFCAEKIWDGGELSFCCFADVFEGGFGKSGVQAWCFCGQVVVDCVANVDKKLLFAAAEK
jgi:hypothetical protein